MIRKLLLLSGIVGALVLASVWASPRDSDATPWNPHFAPADFYTVSPSTPGANGDTLAQFNVPAPSANFSALFGRAITFGDPDVTTASAAQIPGVGAYMGQLASVAQLGLANEGCFNEVPVTFNFVDANVTVSALVMSPNVTLTANIANNATSFTYTSTGDPIGPSDANAAHTRAEIEIDSEQMLVETITEGTNTYSTVTRGWNGTAPAAHNAGAQIRKVNVIFPAGPTSNLLANLAEDDGDFDNNGTVEFPSLGGNFISDGADAGAPGFIRDSFDPDGDPDNGGYVTPHARYYGVAFVASALIVTLQFVIMEPGQLTQFQSLDWADANWGYSSTTFLQDPLAPPSNSAISDFCNFTSNTRLFGIPHDNACTGNVSPPAACSSTGAGFTLRLAVDGGCPPAVPTNPNECGLAGQSNGICQATTCPRSTNPPTVQRVRYYQYSVAQRDYDGDDHENGLDACAYHANPNPPYDPRVTNFQSGADGDSDGLPAPCDPNNAAFDNDQDDDGWQNRLDICPLVHNSEGAAQGGGTIANTFQFDQDVDPGVNNVATDVGDGGPANDQMGPACDVAGNSCGGCPALTPTGANGHYHATAAAQTICIGTDVASAQAECSATLDNDADGVVNGRDTCLNGANPVDVFDSTDTPSGLGWGVLAVGAAAGSTVLTLDSVAGFTRTSTVIGSPQETIRYVTFINAGTNQITINEGLAFAHQANDPVNQVRFAQSFRDMNNDGFSDITDGSALNGAFGSQGGDPAQDGVGDSAPPGYQGRYDVNYDGVVDISDISALDGVFGAQCGPPA